MSRSLRTRYLPTSLFGRAILILLAPVLAILTIVSLAFIQRHYDGVTQQLARGVALELDGIVQNIERAGRLTPAILQGAARLDLEIALDPGPPPVPGEIRRWYDVTGRTIHRLLEDVIARPIALNLADNPRQAQIHLPTEAGSLHILVPRARLSAANPHQLPVLMFAGALLFTLISVLFLRNQIRPILRLADAAEAFGKGRTVPFRISGADEVRRAGWAFLAMRARIERQIEQRTTMLSGVSHDLRTPLTRMKLALATSDCHEDLDALAADITEMEAMITAFLDFSRDAADEETAWIAPGELAQQAISQAERAGGRVELIMQGDIQAEVPIRRGQMMRALGNLLDNGARHGRCVRLSLARTPRNVTFAVEDDGPGIVDADRARALKPFTRLDPARNQDSGSGVGLGLAIALDTARLHGGTLTLDDSPDLGGLRASLTIPV